MQQPVGQLWFENNSLRTQKVKFRLEIGVWRKNCKIFVFIYLKKMSKRKSKKDKNC